MVCCTSAVRTHSATGCCFTPSEGGRETTCADTFPTPMFVSFFWRGVAWHCITVLLFLFFSACGCCHGKCSSSGSMKWTVHHLSLFSASQLPCMTKSVLFFSSYFIIYIFLSIPAVRHKLETFFALQREKKTPSCRRPNNKKGTN